MGAGRPQFSTEDERFMRRALLLAERGYGATSPNPKVGAVLVRSGEVLGEGWHKRAGEAHAEVNAVKAARRKGHELRGATLFVTLEPCSTFGRTPPCSELLLAEGISRVVVGATDPNPKHAGAAYRILRGRGVRVETGLLRAECEGLNEVFNHWIVERRPFVISKCAMSLDGKIGTNCGESKWITSKKSRAFAMRLRVGADAILCGINTVLRDDPGLSLRPCAGVRIPDGKRFLRIVLDREARTPLESRVLDDAHPTLVVVSNGADRKRLKALEKRARVMEIALSKNGRTFNLSALLRKLAEEEITSLFVEGGGETHATFYAQKLVQRAYFFYAPLVITGRAAPKAVAGANTVNRGRGYRLVSPEWRALGPDLLLSGLVRD